MGTFCKVFRKRDRPHHDTLKGYRDRLMTKKERCTLRETSEGRSRQRVIANDRIEQSGLPCLLRHYMTVHESTKRKIRSFILPTSSSRHIRTGG